MPAIPCGHCRRPACRLCHLYRTDARYRALWAADRPRVAVADLVARKRH